jgi:heat shock protein HslJ
MILSSFNKKQLEMNDSQNQFREEITPDSIQWRLTKIYNADSFVQVSNTKGFIHFNTGDGRINGNGSCNSFGGKLTVYGNNLRFDNIFSTKMYCTDVQTIEDQFFRQLQLVTGFEIKGNRLQLLAGDILVLEFEARLKY